jgi:tetratricopeptide (TPR) repeat protein
MRRVLIGMATLAGAVLVTAPTVALTLGRYNSDLGLRFWPIGAAVQASKASELVATNLSVPTLERADRLSRAALRREPINVTAARVQGLIAAARGQERNTLAWFDYAERLSRRDFPVQTMLIELAVARGDIDGALVHYDRALRTKKAAGDVLFPVLFSATADPNVLPALTRLLRTRPEWWYDFTVRWQTQQPPVEPLFKVLMAERLNVSDPRERGLAINSMRQMVTAGRSDLAARLHDSIAPRGTPRAGSFVDGNFAGTHDLLPFAWDIANEPGLSGAVERRGEPARSALTIDIGGDQGGTIARQLVRLAPGRYRLAFRIGEVSAEGVVPSISIVCAGAGQPLVEQRIAPTPLAVRGITFQVGPGCTAQTIQIGGAAGEKDSVPRPWITDMVLRRLD